MPAFTVRGGANGAVELRREGRVPRPLLDAERVVTTRRHPRDPRRPEVVERDRLARLVPGEELGPVDSGLLQVVAELPREHPGRRHLGDHAPPAALLVVEQSVPPPIPRSGGDRSPTISRASPRRGSSAASPCTRSRRGRAGRTSGASNRRSGAPQTSARPRCARARASRRSRRAPRGRRPARASWLRLGCGRELDAEARRRVTDRAARDGEGAALDGSDDRSRVDVAFDCEATDRARGKPCAYAHAHEHAVTSACTPRESGVRRWITRTGLVRVVLRASLQRSTASLAKSVGLGLELLWRRVPHRRLSSECSHGQ